VKQLIAAPEFEGTMRQCLFVEVRDLLLEGKFISDHEQIALQAPELRAQTIQSFFVHVGYSTSQKTLGISFARSLDFDQVMYHAIAEATLGSTRYLYMLTKVEASFATDPSTKQKTPAGERPLRQEYLTILKMQVINTSVHDHGHTLGLVGSLLDAFCSVCTAGGSGLCLHTAEACWVQFHHWIEGRPTERPSTIDICEFTNKGKANTSSLMRPVTEMKCIKKPKSIEEANYRKERNAKRNATEGLSAQFDVFGGDKEKRAKVAHGSMMFDTKRPAIQKLWACLRRDNAQRPNHTPWEKGNEV
jgi:hypothetical protein